MLFFGILGHTDEITSLTFSSPSSFISASYDKYIRFWQLGASSTAPAIIYPKSIPLDSVPIKPITLQAKDGITISSDLGGVIMIWNISTGLCISSFFFFFVFWFIVLGW